MTDSTFEEDRARAREEARRQEAARMKRGLMVGAIVLALAALVWGLLSPMDAEDLARGRMGAFGAVAGGSVLKAMMAAGVVFAGVYFLIIKSADGTDIAKGFGLLCIVGYVAMVLGAGLRAEADIRHVAFAKALDLVRSGRGSARINAETYDVQFRSSGIRNAFAGYNSYSASNGYMTYNAFVPQKLSADLVHDYIQRLHGLVADARTQYAHNRAQARAGMSFWSRDLLDEDTKALQPQVDRYWATQDRLLDDLDAAGAFIANTPPSGYFYLIHRDFDAVAFDSKSYTYRPPTDQAFQALVDKIKADSAQLDTLRVAIDAREAKDLQALSNRRF